MSRFTDRRFRIAYDPVYAHPLPEGHRFPMLKYELIPGQLLYEGTISEENIHRPAPCADSNVLAVHDAAYVERLKNGGLTPREQRVIGFPWSAALQQREWVITQGTIDCCLHALQAGVALNVAGGTHHAFADHGEGFCLVNDFAVASSYLLRHRLARQILIIDLDVHQGNGTAALFGHEPRVFTFSMHGRHNYPFRKERSDLDVPLEDGTDTDTYLQLLKEHLPSLLRSVRPDFCCYLSGVDILDTDKFGKLKVSLEGCAERDAYVLSTLRAAGLPCAVSMGGGYSEDIKRIVEAHCATFRIAREVYGLD